MSRLLMIGVFALTLSGCMLGPDYKRPQLDLPQAYPEAAPRGTTEAALPAQWWTLYGDETLNKLVASGLQRNADVKLAVARIEEAEAVIREANAAYFPTVDANASGTRSRISENGTQATAPGVRILRNDFQLTASTAFELDFWGRLRRASEAARAQYAATRYGSEVVRLTLIAGIAQTYFAVRSLDTQLDVARETLRSTDESLDIVRKRAQGGLVSDLDVNQAETQRAAAAAQTKTLARSRAVFLHQLGELSGMLDLHLDAGSLRDLPIPPLPPAGLPSTLLERRPDVRQAEANLASANAQIGVARADQFPTFSLTGSFGQQSSQLGSLLESGSRIWSIGLGVVGPIFDAGLFAARTDEAEARQRQATALYQKAAETAFREVADALSNVEQTADVEKDLGERVARATNTLRLANLRYRSGYSGFLDVLDAQRTLNSARLDLAQNREAYLSYSVDLMKALGGGWTAASDMPQLEQRSAMPAAPKAVSAAGQ